MLNIKKFATIIKNKRFNGNISILVILILLASSVITLLAINQIQHLMVYGGMTFNYFRSYYLSKAGLELALTEVYQRGDGFNDTIGTGNFIENFLTGYNWSGSDSSSISGDFAAYEPRFDCTITGSFIYLTDNPLYSSTCSDNKITLGAGSGMTISLFKDITNKRLISAESGEYQRLSNIEGLSLEGKSAGDLMLGFFTFSESSDMSMSYINVAKGNDLTSFLKGKSNNDYSYLTIKNPTDSNIEFCVYAKGQQIPSSNFLITSRGYYGDMEVGLQSVINKQTPSWAMDILSLGSDL